MHNVSWCYRTKFLQLLCKQLLRKTLLCNLLGCGFLLWGGLSFAEEYLPVAGRDYKVLTNPVATDSADKIKVIEFFWYGCPHCYTMEPYVESWLKSKPDFVDFQRVPAPFGHIWDVHARAFYTAETMGVLDKTHQATFDAIHRDKKTLVRMQQIRKFYEKLGIDGDAFAQTFDSFIVDFRFNQAKAMIADYGLQSVPVLAVGGKYLINVTQNSGHAGMMKTLDYLIQQEYQLMQGPQHLSTKNTATENME